MAGGIFLPASAVCTRAETEQTGLSLYLPTHSSLFFRVSAPGRPPCYLVPDDVSRVFPSASPVATPLTPHLVQRGPVLSWTVASRLTHRPSPFSLRFVVHKRPHHQDNPEVQVRPVCR